MVKKKLCLSFSERRLKIMLMKYLPIILYLILITENRLITLSSIDKISKIHEFKNETSVFIFSTATIHFKTTYTNSFIIHTNWIRQAVVNTRCHTHLVLPCFSVCNFYFQNYNDVGHAVSKGFWVSTNCTQLKRDKILTICEYRF